MDIRSSTTKSTWPSEELETTIVNNLEDSDDEPTYLWTIADLEANAVVKLGSMEEASYDTYVERMNKIAAEAGIVRPRLAIGIKFKEGNSVEEQPYAITEKEWAIFQKDAKTMCEYMPKVFVIDGSKFALPI